MRKDTSNWLDTSEYDLDTAGHMYDTGRYISDAMKDFIGKLNGTNIATRYPEDLKKLLSVYTKEIADEYLRQTREAINWIKKDKRLTG